MGNHRLAFVVGAALAGPLLHMLGHESGGFIAKSLTQRSFSHHESVNQMIQVNRQF
ncbi:hypothetical protein GCM10009085_19010 [Pseudomonas avellanae]|nr:hypothetical protein GCM10009085_19010 [Pseudomonas avellanae]